jgi:hypothetical protein
MPETSHASETTETSEVKPDEVQDCAVRPYTAGALQAEDGTWTAYWQLSDRRGGMTCKERTGFDSEEAAVAHAHRVELAERLNRC